ncbi:LysR family transcriptional regulator [Polycladidibacter hongkongensis]|uniref:LysR family transcriptional regulator n=1 Tax=Polycladidibacter hongkongensis TaxID=1647556 RepID=UPI000829B879|nr:LysR family transcriptional regulator [Pseudovibrio hongkongensis]
MKPIWQDLDLFLAVARTGGLSTAATQTGLSPATLGRRMLKLERQTNRQLFRRHARGYTLTQDGKELLTLAEAAERELSAISRWQEGAEQKPTLRLSAGSWTCRFLTVNYSKLWQADDPFNLCVIEANHKQDLGRREVEIGIRNARPEQDWLAGKQLTRVCFAAYCAPHLLTNSDGEDLPWLSPLEKDTPSVKWLQESASTPLLHCASNRGDLLTLAIAGHGRILLPCFIGDTQPLLVRASGVIDALSQEQWLVTHHEDRFQSAQRTMIKRISNLLLSNRPLFAGLNGEQHRPMTS